MKNVGRIVLASVLAVLLWASSSPGARAELPPIWWLPPAWVEVVAGVAEVGVNVLTGRADQSPVSGGADPTELSVRTPGTGGCYYPVVAGSMTVVGTDVQFDYRVVHLDGYCQYNLYPTSAYDPSTFRAQCANGQWVTVGAVYSATAPTTSDWGGTYRRRIQVGTNCATRGGAVLFASGGYSGQVAWQASQDSMKFHLNAELATTSTEVVCRGADGDFTVSETSAPGATVAPSPVCPAGSMPVRVTVTNSVDGVLSDTSVTAPDWYLSSPGTVDFEMGIGPNRCIAGMADCDLVKSDPDQYWNDTTHTCWAKQRDLEPLMAINASYSGDAGDWVQVPDDLCKDPDNPSGAAPMPTPPETPSDPDQGIISRGLERIKEAVDRVKEAVKGAAAEAKRQSELTREAIKNAADRAAADAAAGREAVRDAAESTGEAIGRAVTPDAGVMAGLGSRAEAALGDPFAEWTGAWSGLVSSFDVSSSGCQGPPFDFRSVNGGLHHPLQSCDGQGARIAGFVSLVTGASVCIAGFLACVRILGASIGLQTGQGVGGDS